MSRLTSSRRGNHFVVSTVCSALGEHKVDLGNFTCKRCSDCPLYAPIHELEEVLDVKTVQDDG